MAKKRLLELLVPPFPKKNITASLCHYTELVSDFQAGRWENCLAMVGKLVEAVLKALYIHVGETPPSGRGFKADTIINGLASKPQGTCDDSIRLLIPRACRFIYDIVSNRGGRHDPDEVDPNEMDARVSVPICSWILAEMVRVSQKGTINLEDVKALVDSLTAKKYPYIEEIEGRYYYHFEGLSAPDLALLALARNHPRRIAKQDLISTIRRNGFSLSNAQKAVQRISRLVDDDGSGQLRLLIPGLNKADEIMKAKAANL
jgi:hypothetical protein